MTEVIDAPEEIGVVFEEDVADPANLPVAFQFLSTEAQTKFQFSTETYAALNETGQAVVIVEFAVTSFFDGAPVIAADAGPSEMDAARMAEVAFARGVLIDDLVPALSHEVARRERAHLGLDAVLDDDAEDKDDSLTGPANLAEGDRLIYAYAFSPMFAARLTTAELAALAADPRVIRIYENVGSESQLPRSTQMLDIVGLHNAGDRYRGTGMAVAILDNGFDTSHPMIASRVQRGWCFSSAPNPGDTSLCTAASGVASAGNCTIAKCEHGTHVAATAAGGWRFNGPLLDDPLTSVAPYSQLWLVNVFSRRIDPTPNNDSDDRLTSYPTDQLAALDALYAARNDIPGTTLAAINMSLGGTLYGQGCENPLRSIIQLLRNAGVATVIAAGNDGNVNAVTAPGCIPEAITVAAVGFDRRISGYSNIAPMVDVLAPGGDFNDPQDYDNNCLKAIVSAVPTLSASQQGACTYGGSSGRVRASQGTSMAAPHIAGIVAMMRGVWPHYRIDDIETAMEQTGTMVSDHRRNGTNSAPLVNGRLTYNSLVGTQTRSRPSNDNFLNAAGVSGTSFQVTGVNIDATIDAGEPRHGTPGAGDRTVWWRWTAPITGQVTITTDGSGFDTTLAAYTGTVVNNLTLLAGDDDGGEGARSRIVFNIAQGQVVHIAVAGFGAANGSIVLNLSMPVGNLTVASTTEWATTIYQQQPYATFRNYTLANDGNNALTYAVSSAASWLGFGSATSGTLNAGAQATLRAQLNTSAVNALALGNYATSITVDPSVGANISLPVTVSVRPQNDLFQNALALTGAEATATGSNVNAASETGEPKHGSTNAGPASVWWRWQAPSTGPVTVNTNGSDFDTTLAVYSGSPVSALTLRGGDDDGGDGQASLVTFEASRGATYRIAVAGYNTRTGNITLNLSQPTVTETLTVNIRGLGTGTVTDGVRICATGESCVVTPDRDSTVTLTAAADFGSQFAGWDYGCTDTTSTTCSVRMSGPRTVWARFTQNSVDNGNVVAAILPGARSGYVGGPPLTAFMSVVSRRTTPAQGCRVTAPADAPATLSYRELDANRQLVDGPNAPVFDLPNGGSVNLVLGLVPTATTGPNGYVLQPQIDCDNANLTGIEGVNTLQLSIGSAPVPDLVSIGATVSGDGVIRVPVTGNRINFMSASALNIGSGDGSGAAGTATVTVTADTGSVSLPVTIQVCETGADGVCLAPRSSSVTSVFSGTTARTFAVFVRVNEGAYVPFSPANNRVYLRFRDANGVLRSAYSAAVSSPEPSADLPESVEVLDTAMNDNAEIALD